MFYLSDFLIFIVLSLQEKDENFYGMQMQVLVDIFHPFLSSKGLFCFIYLLIYLFIYFLPIKTLSF